MRCLNDARPVRPSLSAGVYEIDGDWRDNKTSGDSDSNTIDGKEGDDTPRGLAGGDALIGGDGNDKLYGVEGKDSKKMKIHDIPSYFRGEKFLLYVPLATAIALIPSIVLAMTAFRIALWFDPNFFSAQPTPPPETPFRIFTSSLPVPLIETWIVMWIIRTVRRFVHRPGLIATITAVICAIAHELALPLWFFGTVWSFFIFSYGFLIWQPYSSRYAFFAAFLPHALLNFLVSLSVIFWP